MLQDPRIPPSELTRLRIDNVGSMLRPENLQQATLRQHAGELTGDHLAEIEDAAIEELVREQEAHDLPLIVDGEFRRRQFMESFAEIAGFDWADAHASAAPAPPTSGGREEIPTALGTAVPLTPATEPLRLRRNVPLEEFRFTQALTDRPVKITLIGPERILSAYDAAASSDVYGDPDEFLADVVAVQRQVIGELVDAGCRYVHIDAPGFTRYVDERVLERMRGDGIDPVAVMAKAAEAENAVIAGFDDVVFGIHLCRGNHRSRWYREGHYDVIAEQLFSALQHDRLLLEYDTERAGGFEPLRHVRDDTVAVLGLITTKTGELEDADALLRRIDDAAQYVPLERLALSPQCGFASSSEGNDITIDEQWHKLDLMMDVAQRVWG